MKEKVGEDKNRLGLGHIRQEVYGYRMAEVKMAGNKEARESRVEFGVVEFMERNGRTSHIPYWRVESDEGYEEWLKKSEVEIVEKVEPDEEVKVRMARMLWAGVDLLVAVAVAYDRPGLEEEVTKKAKEIKEKMGTEPQIIGLRSQRRSAVGKSILVAMMSLRDKEMVIDGDRFAVGEGSIEYIDYLKSINFDPHSNPDDYVEAIRDFYRLRESNGEVAGSNDWSLGHILDLMIKTYLENTNHQRIWLELGGMRVVDGQDTRPMNPVDAMKYAFPCVVLWREWTNGGEVEDDYQYVTGEVIGDYLGQLQDQLMVVDSQWQMMQNWMRMAMFPGFVGKPKPEYLGVVKVKS